MRRDVVGRIAERFEQYGDLYCAPFLGRDVYVLRHPAHIQEVLLNQAHRFEKPSSGLMARQLHRLLGQGLLNSNGELWRRQRRLIQPAFRKETVQAYAPVVVAQTRELLDGLRPGETVDIAQTMMHLTLRIVSKALFALELDGEIERFGRAMSAFRGAFSRLGAALPNWLPSPAQRRALLALAEVDEIIYALIDNPQVTRGHHLLSTLVGSSDATKAPSGGDRKQLREALLILASTAQRFLLRAIPGTVVELDMALTLAPKGGLPMRIEHRPRREDFTVRSHLGT